MIEPLMMQAESLHREVAQLSNSLHTFDDQDVAGVKPVIDKILEKRNAWKEVRLKIEHFEKFGSLPEEKKDSKVALEGTAAELKVSIASIQAHIRKLRFKILNQPLHRLETKWLEELAMNEAMLKSFQMQILQHNYK